MNHGGSTLFFFLVMAGKPRGGAWYYEVRSPERNPAVFQPGTFCRDSPSTLDGLDSDGFNRVTCCGIQCFRRAMPGCSYTGPVPSDRRARWESEGTSIIEGKDRRPTVTSRWGDYSGMRSTADERHLGYTTEYLTKLTVRLLEDSPLGL